MPFVLIPCVVLGAVFPTGLALGVDFRRGDADANGFTDFCDAIFMNDFLFEGGDSPTCFDAADVNDDELIDVSDPISLFFWLFQGGTVPPAPGPFTCGPDPFGIGLDCAVYDTCTSGATEPCDRDGDALLDEWEILGLDSDGDGTIDLDLPAMGADPLHKDIFVEIDYMVESGSTGHSHQPLSAALDIVIAAFDAAPVDNPDGTTGIHLHIDAGPGSIMFFDSTMSPVTWGSMSESDALTHVDELGVESSGSYRWARTSSSDPRTFFDDIKNGLLGAPAHFSDDRRAVFHYCIWAHNLAGTFSNRSGISRASGMPASDSIVSLGLWHGMVGTVWEQTGTLMHELGHNLGLLHESDLRGPSPYFPRSRAGGRVWPVRRRRGERHTRGSAH